MPGNSKSQAGPGAALERPWSGLCLKLRGKVPSTKPQHFAPANQIDALPWSGLQFEIGARETEGGLAVTGNGGEIFGIPAFDFRIQPMEANDSIFEFALPGPLRQDGSGGKDRETLHENFFFHVERECPQSFPQKQLRVRRRAVSRQVPIYFE